MTNHKEIPDLQVPVLEYPSIFEGFYEMQELMPFEKTQNEKDLYILKRKQRRKDYSKSNKRRLRESKKKHIGRSMLL